MAYPLYVALIWHMHQPYYKDGQTSEYILPWARLHAVKDYLHMAEVLADHPDVHATFNVVPSLVEQLEEYVTGEALDRIQVLSLQESWTSDERAYLLANCFSINWDNIIRRYPRYWQLLQLRQQAPSEALLFTDDYYRDLVAWFNLAWIDPNWLERDPLLRELVTKGRHFCLADVRAILDKQREIIGKILPLYRELATRGQLELAVSPYYHPILPLVMDNHYARRASPGLPLPNAVFAHPEDASEQIRRAVEAHRRHFGHRPQGMWPSEGAVCPEIVFRLAAEGLTWFASDEAVLALSLDEWVHRDGYGHVTNPTLLYQPYRTHVGARPPAIVFRDRLLSDRIGFVYKQFEGHDAAEDLVHRLHRIRENLNDSHQPYLVTIILDGENCWEEYEHNGDVFLHHFYHLLAVDPDLQAVTVSEYLSEHPPRAETANLHTGSWINHNLETWIGEAEQNRAWECLTRTRDRLIAWQREYSLVDLDVLERAWKAIYVAEGSDWFWWYYSRNFSDQDQLFDAAFRGHLASVYTTVGLPVPDWLEIPIAGLAEPVHCRPASAYVTPHLSAAPAVSLEWTGAGYLEPLPSVGTMQRGHTLIKRLYYGYNPADLFLRLELDEPSLPYRVAFYLAVPGWRKVNRRVRFADTNPALELSSVGLGWEIALPPERHEAILHRADGQEVWRPVKTLTAVAVGETTVELAVSLGGLGLRLGDAVELVATLARDNVLVEALPASDTLSFNLKPMA
ncbi:MAG: glycoside hydrolase family 57 protein [Anaerolineae bacterium]